MKTRGKFILLVLFSLVLSVSVFADLTVHFKRPTTWANVPNCYYWNMSPAVASVTWPGKVMTSEGNGWYKYTIVGANSGNVIFNNNSAPQTSDLTRSSEGWYKDGIWYNSNPDSSDITAPTAALTAPAAGTIVGTVNVSANATDNIGVTKVQFFAGTTLIGEDTTSPYSVSWNTTSVVNGVYALTAESYDAAGNKKISTAVNVTVNNPTVSLTVHFKRPASWANTPYAYAWSTTASTNQGAWPGKIMTSEGNNWYKIVFTGISSTNIIFNNNSSPQTTDLFIDKEGWYDGATNTWYYTNPNIDTTVPVVEALPDAGRFEQSSLAVTLKVTDNADTAPVAYYTTNGTAPTTASTKYTGAFTLSGTNPISLKVLAVDKSNNSKVYTFVYYLGVDSTPPVVTATPAPGNYSSAQTVTLKATDNKDTAPKIYYTTNGTTPTTKSALYTSGISVSSNTTIKTIALDASGNESAGSFYYTIGAQPVTRGDFREESIYFVMTPRFYDGDSTNNVHCWDDAQAKNPDTDPAWRGDFKGLIDQLDYIKALGFTAIWITPVVSNASGYDYHGYHAINFKKVDPRYKHVGASTPEASYKQFIDAAHAKGMKVIQDIVLNHTGNFGEENIKPMFTRKAPTSIDESSATALSQVAGALPSNYATMTPAQQYQARLALMKDPAKDVTNMYHHETAMQWEGYSVQTGQIAGDCVDLNTENPEVAKYLIDAYNQYIDMGVDGFRIDTVKHISRLTFNNYFIPAFKQRGGNNFYIFGEVATRYRQVWNNNIPAISTPFYTWKESKAYPWGDRVTNEASVYQNWSENQNPAAQPSSSNHLLNGNNYRTPDYSKRSGLDVIDFPMHWNFNNAGDAFNVAIQGDSTYNDATWNVTYVDSHDYAPDGAPENQRFAGSQDTWAENLSLMFTFRGIPTVYYGSEIEFQKGKMIDVGPNAPLSTTGRAYFGDFLAGNVTASDFGVYTATGTVANTLTHPLAKHIRKLNMMRRAIPALQKGQYSREGVNGNMAFKRRFTDSAKGIDSFVLVTVSGGATFSGIPNGTYVDAVTGETINVTAGTLTANCSGKGNARVFVLNGKGKIGNEAGTYLK